MSSLKKLAGQTAIYGFTNILGRLLNYLLVPLYTGILKPELYAPVTKVYAWIPFLSVLFTYGMETSFFRFSQNTEDRKKVLSTSSISLLFTTIIFTILLIYFRDVLSLWMDLGNHPEYIVYFALILAFDTLTAIPFANLRLQNRPIRYSLVKIINIGINIGLNVFFLLACPWFVANNYTWVAAFYDPSLAVSYIFISNLTASAVTWLILLPEITGIDWKIDKPLLKRLVTYSLPLIIVGLAGMVNETLDRAYFLPNFLPYSKQQNDYLIGVYGANYKLSILITLFIQAFRMGAEPFFFQQAAAKDARQTYARVMKYFVIVLSIMFLSVAMYMNVWKYFLRQEVYWQGLYVVPTLLLANIFLGIYYNLSIWFKLSNQTKMGAYITIITAILAFVLNIWWIPIYGYFGSAMATMICYGVQMSICYWLGQKYYPIPYPTKKLLSIIGLSVFFYGVYWVIIRYFISPHDIYALNPISIFIATAMLLTFIYIMYRIEKPYLKNLRSPVA
ncbi:MAG: polysaccharide biosynthesis C-terminal domain-containing protein [Ginsengibacter sp.]